MLKTTFCFETIIRYCNTRILFGIVNIDKCILPVITKNNLFVINFSYSGSK